LRHVLVALLLLLGGVIPAAAHPGVGIVIDPQGNVFYTDLAHVWRIAPDGRKSIAVRDVHTHELAVDDAGYLVGEDSEYLGGDHYRHRIWRRSPAGQITDVVPWRDGFWRDYSFVRDRAGVVYLVRCEGAAFCTVQKRTPDGRVSDAAQGVRFGRGLSWLAAAPGGGVYVADGRDLRRIDARGRATVVARDMGVRGAAGIMGMWPDARGDVYVAVFGSRTVERVSPDGRAVTVARSQPPWSPTGVVKAQGGDLWVLEYSASNEARVRRVARNGRSTIY
jgi:streptogramin lyase